MISDRFGNSASPGPIEYATFATVAAHRQPQCCWCGGEGGIGFALVQPMVPFRR
jgi:hypothetical protein